MGYYGIDKFRFETNLMGYQGKVTREDGFRDYGEYLGYKFAQNGLSFLEGAQIAQGPDHLLDWSNRIVELTEEMMLGKILSSLDIDVRMRGIQGALIQFGSTAMDDYKWANSKDDSNAEELVIRRGGGNTSWLEWEASKKKEIREGVLKGLSPDQKINRMKAIELTGDPLLATAEAFALLDQLVALQARQ